ncbi:MAG: Trm112 family protein [Aquificae bacterium]|nr:Trm112 family protein [Aquificota bacterium]
MLNSEVLGILACPKCKGDLLFVNNCFVCESCMLKFEIVEGIPNFIIDEAKPISQEELKQLKDER